MSFRNVYSKQNDQFANPACGNWRSYPPLPPWQVLWLRCLPCLGAIADTELVDNGTRLVAFSEKLENYRFSGSSSMTAVKSLRLNTIILRSRGDFYAAVASIRVPSTVFSLLFVISKILSVTRCTGSLSRSTLIHTYPPVTSFPREWLSMAFRA